ncbi:Hypothetical predicted protein [Olea europaea subsp. europaea]|uniref:Uncharacterized protein n=1 Tax=Olea europaea subsp. europaea TaxID=158383 RepID=A0A8S0RS63_OLEEU|nr:Hypothetical predicted protein [Olea europaea subsp. europaea]
MEGVAKQFILFSDVVASRFEDSTGGLEDLTGSNENDRNIEEGHMMFRATCYTFVKYPTTVMPWLLILPISKGVNDGILEGVDVNLSNIVGDNGFAKELGPTSSTLSMNLGRSKENVANTKNYDKAKDHCISSSQTHQFFVTQESVDVIERL